MKPRSKTTVGLAGFVLLLIICVQFSNGFSIRDKREAKTNHKKKVTLIKKQGVADSGNKGIDLDEKVKISELKPCISKAFCEVNAITEAPTFEANKEFYTILNRLKTFTAEDDIDGNGSGSVEESEEEPSSEESSYEHIPHGPPPGRQPYPGYRRGKSLNGESDKIKKKNKKKLKDSITKTIVNGTEIEVKESIPRNRTSRVYTPEQKEKQAFVSRKASELNVVDDLAALIKISAEIGQALRSPRRCRALFKKCQMNYEQIIEIFNQTQSVVTDSPPKGKDSITTPKPPKKTTTSKSTTSTTSTPSKEKPTSSEGNRNKKSRPYFSDEDIEYITDTEIQPVRTYALFTPTEQRESRHPEEILVEEAFKKFDNTFPVAGAPENLDFLKKRPSKSKNIPMQQRPPSSSEEEEGSDESTDSQERPGFRIEPPYNGYQHRMSAEAEEDSAASGEFRKAKKQKFPTEAEEEETEPAEQADFEDDSDAPISSQEISKKPQKKQKLPAAEESSEEDEEASDETQTIYTRDEEQPPKGHKHVRPHLGSDDHQDEEEHNLRVKSKGQKGDSNRKGKRRPRPPVDEPEDDQNSSEEEIQRDEEKEMPPPGSPFYNLLSGMNDGQGADGIPGKPPKKGKRPSGGQGGGYSGQGSPQGGYGGGQQGGYGGGPQGGSGYGGPQGGSGYPGSADSAQPSFFQNIMSWFSRSGNKPSTSQEQPYGDQPSASSYGGGSGDYAQKPYGQDLPTYDDYKQSGRPSKYPPSQGGYNSRPSHSSEGYQSGPPSSHKGRPGGRRPPPQGRGEESSEEAEDEEEIKNKKETKKSPSKGKPQGKNQKNGNKSSSKQHLRSGPPPPVVIVPEVEEGYAPNEDFQTVVKSNPSAKPNSNTDSQKSKSKPKPTNKPEPDASEEESRETSSEEAEQNSPQKNNPNGSKKSQGQNNPQGQGTRPANVPSYEKYFTKIFGSAEEHRPNKPKNSPKPTKEDRENTSLLLSEFDKISSSFSTSADKIPDWSEEDNPKKRINVGSLASNSKKAKGKYTVNKNKRTKQSNRPAAGSQYSYEVNTKDDKGSSEEEDKK